MLPGSSLVAYGVGLGITARVQSLVWELRSHIKLHAYHAMVLKQKPHFLYRPGSEPDPDHNWLPLGPSPCPLVSPIAPLILSLLIDTPPPSTRSQAASPGTHHPGSMLPHGNRVPRKALLESLEHKRILLPVDWLSNPGHNLNGKRCHNSELCSQDKVTRNLIPLIRY